MTLLASPFCNFVRQVTYNPIGKSVGKSGLDLTLASPLGEQSAPSLWPQPRLRCLIQPPQRLPPLSATPSWACFAPLPNHPSFLLQGACLAFDSGRLLAEHRSHPAFPPRFPAAPVPSFITSTSRSPLPPVNNNARGPIGIQEEGILANQKTTQSIPPASLSGRAEVDPAVCGW